MIKVFYDLETTGVNPKKHSLHQIAGCIEVDDEVVEWFDIKSKPHPKAIYEPEAMSIGGVTEAQLRGYQDMGVAYNIFKGILSKYIDKYNPKQKAVLVGYNNRYFDDVFLRVWFEQNGDNFIGSWFWNNSLDVLVLSTEYLLDRREDMPSFKLKRVAKEVGIPVDESKLHDAKYDIMLTRQVYRIVTGRDFEI